MDVLDDPEYLRLVALFEMEAAAGNLDLANTYASRAIKRGDELLASIGGRIMFGPICDALDRLLSVAPEKDGA